MTPQLFTLALVLSALALGGLTVAALAGSAIPVWALPVALGLAVLVRLRAGKPGARR